jgi:hypothetical protein
MSARHPLGLKAQGSNFNIETRGSDFNVGAQGPTSTLDALTGSAVRRLARCWAIHIH